MKIANNRFLCVYILALVLGLLPLWGCGGGSDESFSCNFTRSITSGSMRMSVTYDCPDEASCNACSATSGADCSGCREVSRTGGNGDNGGDDDTTTCSVGLELMSGESCSFNDGRNRFTINNTGSHCCLGSSICAGGTLNVNSVLVMRKAEGDCVIEELP